MPPDTASPCLTWRADCSCYAGQGSLHSPDGSAFMANESARQVPTVPLTRGARCLFYGVASAYTHECIEIARRAGIEIRGFVHNLDPNLAPRDLAPLRQPDALSAEERRLPLVFPLITPAWREVLARQTTALGCAEAGMLIHPSAQIAETSPPAPGFNANAGTVIGARSRICRHVLLNRSASVGHDVTLDDYATIGPGAVLGGFVTVGRRAFIGIGATVLPEVTIGADAVVCAGSVVLRDVPARTAVMGNPARVVRTDIPGYNLY